MYQTPSKGKIAILAILGDSRSKFCLFFLGFLSTFAEKWPPSISQPKIGADIFINILFNGEEGDFKDFKGSEVHQSDEIFRNRNWS